MKRGAAVVVSVTLFVIAAVPLSAITTLVLLPLWRFIEERFGIESVGHSGPADWCFILVYALWLSAGGTVFIARARRARVSRVTVSSRNSR